ncbi:MAG: integrase core domain-containing protein [Armatimonadota bacterium]
MGLATVQRWKHRDDPADRSCRPHTVQYAFTPEEEAFLLHLRGQGLALDAVLDAAELVLPRVSRSSIHRLFVRKEVNRRPRPRPESGTFKAYPPGFVHVDCLHLPRLGGPHAYCYVAVDRATRLVYLRVYAQRTKEVAIDFVRRCQAFFPFRIAKLLTDNGGEFTRIVVHTHGRRAVGYRHAFAVYCEQHGMEHRRIKARTPQTNGMVERVNGLIKAATVQRFTYPSAAALREALDVWLVYYNFYRRHSRLGRKTPYQAAQEWYARDPECFTKEPSHLLQYCS